MFTIILWITATVLILALVLFGLLLRYAYVFGAAVTELYYVLSFESVWIGEALERVRKSDSLHLKRYFSAKLLRLVHSQSEYCDGTKDSIDALMFDELLDHLQRLERVTIIEELCTVKWLAVNAFRLRHLPQESTDFLRDAARDFEQLLKDTGVEESEDPAQIAFEHAEHAENEDCFACIFENARDAICVYFVRKLPGGKKLPPLIIPKPRFKHGYASA